MKKSQSLALRVPSLSLRDIADVTFRRKWLIVLTLLTAGFAAAVFASITPDTYESRMKFLVRNTRVETTLTPGDGKVTDRNEVSQEQISSEIELLKSRDILEEIVNTQELAKPLVPGAAITEKDKERAILKLEKDISISAVKRANIIEVEYASEIPEKSASVLQQLSDLYLDKHIRLHHPTGAYEFFKDQADQYEQDLRAAENTLSIFQRRRDVTEIGQQKELTLRSLVETKSRLKDLNGKIKENEKRIAEFGKQLNGMDERITTQNRMIPNQYSAERLNTLLVELRNRRIELLAKFHPNDRIVKEVNDQIEETSEALRQATSVTAIEKSSDVNPLRQALMGDLAKVKVEQAGLIALQTNLSEQVAQYESKLTSLEQATPVHENLTRQVKKKAETYQLYAKKQEESRINDALDEQKISNVSVAEEPIVPHTPNKRNRNLAVVLSLGLGLFFCAGGVFTSELFRETFLRPAELESFTEFPVLATIPHSSERFLDAGNEESDFDFEDLE